MDNTTLRTLIPQLILEQYRQGNRQGRFQAATLFVDLSGFTPLTEALMRHEKDGAEALAAALRDIFSPLVHYVDEYGGLIPLFAGDAFTAIFPVTNSNIDAAQRATTCALAIQRWMVGEGRTIETRYGEFALAVTAGLSFGEVQWGIPGQAETYAFYFRGEGVDNCALAEHEAESGEAIADGRILRILGERITTIPLSARAEEGYVKVIDVVAVNTNSASKADTLTRTDLTPFIAEPILNLTVPAEFREVCVVFLSFQEPQDVAEMHDFIAAAMSLTVTYGGIVNQLDFGDMGGYLLLLFGAPVTHEDDIERAAEFLLALRRQGWSLSWRAGLDYGTVWAGIRGGRERNEYGVAGNVVILACRLFLKAPWDVIWCSQRVAQGLQTRYELTDLGYHSIKGRSEPQPIYRLDDAKLAIADVTPRAMLIGRQAELTQLQTWLQPIFAGQFGGIIYVDGEAGIGKSRLVTELHQSLLNTHECLWLECATDALLHQSLHPFRQALRTYFGSLADANVAENRGRFETALNALIAQLSTQQTQSGAIQPSAPNELMALAQELDRARSVLAALLNIRWAGSFYERLEPQLRFENTLSALKTFFRALALVKPVVIHLEDAHWLDDDSAQALQLLTRNVADVPLVILATARYQDDGTSVRFALTEDVPQQELSLANLTIDGVRTYAEEILDGPLTAASAQDLAQRTNGNPFFVEQLLLDLRERGLVTTEVVDGQPHYQLQAEESGTLPPTLNAVLMARLDRLDPLLKEAVQTASVLGNEFEVPVLTRMLAQDEPLQQRLSAAQHEQIWSALSAVRYLFRHALLRDAAYDMQLRTRLRALHERAGQAIEQIYREALEPHYGSLAYHFDHAEQMGMASRWYGLAGEYAAEQYANEEAVRYYSRALTITPEIETTVATRYTLLAGREEVNNLLGERDSQLRDIESLAVLANTLQDQRKQSDIALRRAAYTLSTGHYHEAAKHAEQAVAFAQQAGDDMAAARAYHRWGRAQWQAGDYVAAQHYLDRALALVDDQQSIETAECYYDYGLVKFYQEDFVSALSYMHNALNRYVIIGNERGQSICLSLHAMILDASGKNIEAIEIYHNAIHLCKKIGWRYAEARIIAQSGVNYLLLGDLTASQHCYEQSMDIFLEIGDREATATSLDTLGLIASFQHQFVKANCYFEQALAIHQRLENRRGQCFVFTHFSYALLRQQKFQRACTYLTKALKLHKGEGGLRLDILAALAFVKLMEHESEEALTYVDEILDWIATNGVIGIEFPIQVYLLCYQVLSALSRSQPELQVRAYATLDTGYHLLQEQATRIPDLAYRKQFMHNIPFNHELEHLWLANRHAL